jgi:hypothetical protein
MGLNSSEGEQKIAREMGMGGLFILHIFSDI